MTPFKALYGQDYLSRLNFSDPTIRVEASKEMIAEMDEQMQDVRKDIKAAQDRQKEYADTKRSDRTFKEGDKVFLRVRPKKSSLSFGRYKKLSPRYCGPYEVVRCLSKHAHKLRLPEHLKVHDVFHVSLLKPYFNRPEHVINDELVIMPSQRTLEPHANRILDTREKSSRNKVIREHLVQWKDYPEEDSTWEDEVKLLQLYPYLFSR